MAYKSLLNRYIELKPAIEKRLIEFSNNRNKKENIFKELIFCILTPQSKAKICWEAVKKLEEKGILFSGRYRQITKCLTGVRFKNNKAKYIKEAQKKFGTNEGLNILKNTIENEKNEKALRDFFITHIKGMGFKEASHFLRNIGRGNNLCILDRHILKNLKKYGVIREIPKHLSLRKYLEIENKMINFSQKITIPVSHLDLLFWSNETGEIFK